MAESDNRLVNGVDNGWFGDCDTVSVVKFLLYLIRIEMSNSCGFR
jgi:hypothetical protein